jgi:hypothetical protein
MPKTRLTQLAELLAWTLVTTVSIVLGLIAFLVVLGALFLTDAYTPLMSLPIVPVAIFFVAGSIAGAIVGGLQRIVLLGNVGGAKTWFWSTAVSWGFVAIAWLAQYEFLGGTDFEISNEDIIPAVLFAGAISGLVLGCAQWLMMRRSVQISPWWIVSTTASWFAATIVIALGGAYLNTIVSDAMRTSMDFGLFSYLAAGVTLGLVVGLGTGLAQLTLGNAIAKAE